MTVTLTSCRKGDPETELQLQLSQLKFDKQESLQSYIERSCKILLPQDQHAAQKVNSLIKKALPKLEKCKQHEQLSLRRVVDIFIYALACRGEATYCKKKILKRTVIIDQNEIFIILKSKGGFLTATSDRRVTLAVRVPFDVTKKASILYQLSNTDTSNRISIEELKSRTIRTESHCRKFKKITLPKIVAGYCYVKEKQGAAKTCVFIRAKDTLASFNPTLDINHKTMYHVDDLLQYIENDDLDSVSFMLKHLSEHYSRYHYSSLIQKAASRNNCAMLKVLLDGKKIQITDDILINSLPKTIETEDEKSITRLLINACQNKEKALADAYCQAVRTSPEHVEFIWSLGEISQKTHIEQLPHAHDLAMVQLIASRIENIGQSCGDAMECAAYSQEWDIVFFFIEKGVDVNYCRDNDGVTALFHAAATQESDETKAVVTKLLDLGANPHLADEYGKTCIYFAAKANNTAIVSILLERSANKEADLKMIENIEASEEELFDSE